MLLGGAFFNFHTSCQLGLIHLFKTEILGTNTKWDFISYISLCFYAYKNTCSIFGENHDILSRIYECMKHCFMSFFSWYIDGCLDKQIVHTMLQMNQNKPVTKIIQAIKTSNGTFKAISIFVQIMAFKYSFKNMGNVTKVCFRYLQCLTIAIIFELIYL